MDINIIGIKTLQLLLSFCILVVMHEGGHFFFSKLFGVRVEKFFVFFDWHFHLFSTKDKWFTRLFPKMKDKETEYGIGWIPLGGYVKIAGMVDESMDTNQLQSEPQPDEFRAQSVWKRFLIMVGGVLVNVILAFVIYACVMLAWGRDVLPMRSIAQGFAFNAQAEQLGFRDGDIPIQIDGDEIEGYSTSILRDLSDAKTITVLRDGREVLIRMPEDGISLLDLLEMNPPFLTPVAPCRIDSVLPATPAMQAGIKAGSTILSIDGTDVRYWSDFDSLMADRTERDLPLVVMEENAAQPDTLTLTLTEDMKMGVLRGIPITEEQFVHIDYNALTCIPAGIKHGCTVLADYVNDLKYVFTAKGVKSVGSFITIGSIFPSTWDWERFWNLTALISIMLAVMNILPIPALDGGHVVLLLYEAITRRKPSEKVLVWLEYIGLALLLALMVLACGNDIVRWVLPQFTH